MYAQLDSGKVTTTAALGNVQLWATCRIRREHIMVEVLVSDDARTTTWIICCIEFMH